MGLNRIATRLAAGSIGLASLFAAATASAEPTHELLLTNGNTVKIEILSESDSEVKARVYFGSMAAPRTFQRSEIIALTKLTESGEASAEASTRSVTIDRPTSAVPENAVSVYVIELSGRFGWDITYTPIKEAMDKARDLGADVVVVKLNNNWRSINEDFTDEKYDDEGQFDEVSVVEKVEPVFTSQLLADWKEQPRVVFWVERAMSGMAFLPLLKNDIYFTSDGRLGGVGNLDDMFGSRGDEVVRDKQESLRLARVEGMAITGGHAPEIVQAMTRRTLSFWYKIEFGRPVFYEGETAPDGAGWIQLTDNGEGDNADTDEQIVRDLGNDTLTMNSDTAQNIGFSKGTVDELDDLLFQLGIEDRAVVIDDSDDSDVADTSERAMRTWSEGLTRAVRQLRRLDFDLANVRAPELRNDPGGQRARNAVRAQQIKLIDQAIRLYRQYAEVLDPNEQNQAALAVRKQQIENEIRRERSNGGG